MDEWKSSKIIDIALIGDGAHSSLKRVIEGVPYLTSKNFKPDRIDLRHVDYISNETYERYFKKDSKALTTPRCGDILLSIIGTIGAPYVVKKGEKFGLSSSVSIIRPKKINANYLYYWIKSKMFQGAIHQIKSGVAQSFLSLPMIGSLPVNYPKLESTQVKIANILSNYDNLIDANSKRIKLLEEYIKITYEEWFLYFRIDGNQLDIDKNTNLPFGWKRNPIGLYVKFHGGYTFKSENYEVNQKYKIVTIKNVQDGYFVPEKNNTISIKPNNINPNQILSSGDYIMSLTGNVGRVCLVYGKDYLLNQRVVKIEPKKLIDYSFVYATFGNINTLRLLENISYGTAQQNLSTVNIEKIKMPIPNEELREKFNNKIKPNIDLIINLYLQNILLKEARDIILPRLMTGVINTEKMDIAI